MKVSSIMTANVRTVNPKESVRKAVKLMNRFRIGSVVVVDDGKIAGILTERDILKRVVAVNKKPESINCKSVMSRNVRTIDTDDSVVNAIDIMARNKIKKLPVTEEGELVGIVTATDILKSGERIEYVALKKLAQFFPISRPVAQAG